MGVIRTRSMSAVRPAPGAPLSRSVSLQCVKRRYANPTTSVSHKMFAGPDRTVARDLWEGYKYRPHWNRGGWEKFDTYDPYYYLAPSWSCYKYPQPKTTVTESPHHQARYNPRISHFPRYKWHSHHLNNPYSTNRAIIAWERDEIKQPTSMAYPYQPWQHERDEVNRAKDMYLQGHIKGNTLDKYWLSSSWYRSTDRWWKWHNIPGYQSSNRYHFYYL